MISAVISEDRCMKSEQASIDGPPSAGKGMIRLDSLACDVALSVTFSYSDGISSSESYQVRDPTTSDSRVFSMASTAFSSESCPPCTSSLTLSESSTAS
jgi:hypothetical protein